MARSFCVTILAMVLSGALTEDIDAAQAWGSIAISGGSAVFKNSVWEAGYVSNGAETCLNDLKPAGMTGTIVGGYCDCSSSRGTLSSASVTAENADSMSAHLSWAAGDAQMTMFKDRMILRTAYSSNSWNVGDQIGGSDWVIYGMENWKRTVAGTPYPSCYFSRGADAGCANCGSGDGNPTALLYKNWFILGVIRSDGIGYGRVIDNTLDIIKLLPWNKGYEIFWHAHTSYIYLTKGGQNKIISRGKAIVDWIAGGAYPASDAGTAVTQRTGPTIKDAQIVCTPSAVTIRGIADGVYKMELLRLDGSVVVASRGQTNTGDRQLSLRGLPQGVYVVRLLAPAGAMTKMIMVEQGI
ncbi:MAG: hypothetical protein PHC61_01575 [Chitinivibrionales bacterium]|nr:hypothetical protein [Chitinivibrionales bacterium]